MALVNPPLAACHSLPASFYTRTNYRYTTFLLQHFPSSPARVLPHLESATRRFVDDPRFAQDGRYLRLWTLYARLVERREEVWAFLESRGIGTRHAGFYEEWSAALEGLNR